MKLDLDTFNLWIKRHKLFAFSAPIIVFLMVYFLVNSISSFGQKSKTLVEDGGYNENLPGQENEMEIEKPNELYKKQQQDSLERLRNNGTLKNIVETKRRNDSLEQVLEELNAFSFDDEQSIRTTEIPAIPEKELIADPKSVFQEKLEYRKLMMEARDERLSRSQDYSAPYEESSNKLSANSISLNAAIYRDQFILPGNRVTLILKEDTYYNGKRFPKNTFVYATSNIQGSRILLEVTNINNVKMSLTAVDQEDGMTGLHNERAGELMQEFVTAVQREGTDELSEAVGDVTDLPLARNLVRSFGNFFTKKKYKQRDKILLVNGDRVFLTAKK
ncbi:conjugative transposon protein TraM [Maribacter sp. 4G9]|uniref:conjugative transposon protein TraM n=1 Tax=Maribacter sp. 4G9 TaxID=1889777 RepID=UPI000C154BAD|nr:conjugative transposon protein TraM [Maribacter sp. 4G9]PIB31443.1 hypothetical protein BFP75_01465 [Maribacter sp. 4G9]